MNAQYAATSYGLAPRISYPCYKSFDEFIDVKRLKCLDGYISERIERHIGQQTDSYFLNDHPLDESTPNKTAVREIWLSQTKGGVPYNYLDLDKPKLWEPAPASAEFGLLMDFISTLPFAALGRMLIIYDHIGTPVPAHRDHVFTDLCHEFIWLRTNTRKPFYLLNPKTNDKLYVTSHSAWFDSVNQFHGADAGNELSFSIRVDGVFTKTFRKHIPFVEGNRAATPAVWATLSNAPLAREMIAPPTVMKETHSQQKEINIDSN
jgi:hypothetical protein